jgi:putative flavoprotein involved in K+ transport
LDRARRVGDSWRNRHDSLRLFSTRASSALAGLALPGDPHGYPTKDEIADYLEAYARRLGAPVRLRTGVRRLSRSGDRFHAEVDGGGVLEARAVVLACGAFQEPVVPPFAAALSSEVLQLTSATYRNPGQLPQRRVLVAGDGATGRQLALELTPGRAVWLATGRPRLVVGRRILGRDQMWWSQRLGLLRASRESAVGRLLRRYEPFPGEELRLRSLRRRGVRIAARASGARGRSVAFADGTSVEVDAVVWAVGWRERTGWVDVPGATDAHGRFVERRGVSPVPGLYFVGREWQWTRGSGLLAGVALDAAYVADRIVERLAPAHGASTAAASDPEAIARAAR